MPRRRVFDVPESEFRSAVDNSLSLRAVIRTLDLHDHTNSYHRLRQRIDDLRLDTSHFRRGGRRPRAFTNEQLRAAVQASRSIRQTLLALGIKAEGANYRTIRRDIKELDLDTSHFLGTAWRRGSIRPVTAPTPLEQILVRNSPYSTAQLRKRLRTARLLSDRCALCGISEWRGAPLSLELDHINGMSNDHRLVNLRFLCPNCHSQTETFRGRNIKQGKTRTPRQLSIL